MKAFPELRRKILEDMLGPSYDAYVNFKREAIISKKRQHRQRIPLWRFLLHLLYLDQQSDLVQWIDTEDLKFKIKSPIDVARLWGSIKDKSDMTYEKLGRAMRYYYGKSIIEKVCGLRYTYRFIVSRKTKRHLDKLAKRRSSTDSTTDTETTTGSDSIDSIDFEDGFEDRYSDDGFPTSFLNEDLHKPLMCDVLCEKFTDINSLEERQHGKYPNEEFPKLFVDESCWPSPHEIFMGMEKVKVLTDEDLDDKDFIAKTIHTPYSFQPDSLLVSASPVEVFSLGDGEVFSGI